MQQQRCSKTTHDVYCTLAVTATNEIKCVAGNNGFPDEGLHMSGEILAKKIRNAIKKIKIKVQWLN
jgi:hypothetical protein